MPDVVKKEDLIIVSAYFNNGNLFIAKIKF